MTYDLNIDFAGLCMFLPEFDTASPPALKAVHVLLLGTEGHADCPPHHARVFYNAAHITEGATGYESIDLDDKFLDLSGFLPQTPSITFDLQHVPDVTAITKKRVTRTLLDANPGNPIVARVKFAAGIAGELLNQPFATAGIKGEQIAYEVSWKISDVQGDSLTWTLHGLNDRGGQSLVALKPITSTTGKPEVNLRIVNVPLDQLSPQRIRGDAPDYGTPASHFHCHYNVLVNPKPMAVPVYIGDEGTGGGSGTAFSCMPSQGQLQLG